MKQISIILILLSASLGIFTHLTHQIYLYTGQLQFLYPGISIYMRYSELTLFLGFLGLSISSKKIRVIAFLIATIIFIHFLFLEYNVIDSYTLLDSLMIVVTLTLLCALLILYRKYDRNLLMAKGHLLIGLSILYGISSVILMSFFQPEITLTSTSWSGTVYIVFYMIYQLGIFLFFKELYGEIYIYHNEVIKNL